MVNYVFSRSRNPLTSRSFLFYPASIVVRRRHSDGDFKLDVVELQISSIVDDFGKTKPKASTRSFDVTSGLDVSVFIFWLGSEFGTSMISFWNYAWIRSNVLQMTTLFLCRTRIRCKLIVKNLKLIVLIYNAVARDWTSKVALLHPSQIIIQNE